jgi:hypothetical protein
MPMELETLVSRVGRLPPIEEDARAILDQTMPPTSDRIDPPPS